jgi:hypothetical protein
MLVVVCCVAYFVFLVARYIRSGKVEGKKYSGLQPKQG